MDIHQDMSEFFYGDYASPKYSGWLKISLPKLYSAIDSVCDPAGISYVGLFGSYVCCRNQKFREKSSWWSRPEELPWNKLPMPPNDLDVLILTSGAPNIQSKRVSGQLEKGWDGGDYGTSWEYIPGNSHNGFFHFLITSRTQFYSEMVTKKDPQAIRIRSQLVRLYGPELEGCSDQEMEAAWAIKF